MRKTEILINQLWELTTDDVLMTIENDKLVNFKKGKVCKVHSTGDKIEAYWLDDFWKPIIISKKEFLQYFKLVLLN